MFLRILEGVVSFIPTFVMDICHHRVKQRKVSISRGWNKYFDNHMTPNFFFPILNKKSNPNNQVSVPMGRVAEYSIKGEINLRTRTKTMLKKALGNYSLKSYIIGNWLPIERQRDQNSFFYCRYPRTMYWRDYVHFNVYF